MYKYKYYTQIQVPIQYIYLYTLNTYQIRIIYVYVQSIYIHIPYIYIYSTYTHTIHTLWPKFFQNPLTITQPQQPTSRINNNNLNFFGFSPSKTNPSTHSIFLSFLSSNNEHHNWDFSPTNTRRNWKKLQWRRNKNRDQTKPFSSCKNQKNLTALLQFFTPSLSSIF